MHLLVIWTWATDWEWRWAQTCPDQHNSNQSMMLYFVTIALKANILQIIINIFISAWSHGKFYVYFEGKVKYIYIFFLFACPIQSSVSRVVGKGLICSCSSLVRVSCIQLYTMSSIITVTLEMLVWGRLCPSWYVDIVDTNIADFVIIWQVGLLPAKHPDQGHYTRIL